MAQRPRPSTRLDFEIALICALRVERDAVEAILDEEYETDGISYGKAPGDPHSYTTGRIGNQHVVLAYMPGMGKASSAGMAASLRMSFERIKLGIIVGICGVAPQTPEGQAVHLGDVIVSTAVVQFDFGRRYPEKFVRKDSHEDTLGRASPEVRSFLGKVSGNLVRERLKQKTAVYTAKVCQRKAYPGASYPGQEADRLYRFDYRHKHQNPAACPLCADCIDLMGDVCEIALNASCEILGCDNEQLSRCGQQRMMGSQTDEAAIAHGFEEGAVHIPWIFFGAFASGDMVMKSGYHRDRIAEAEKVVAFEMEGAGAWDYLPSIIVKGACDYADSHKNKEWQSYASITAASCVKAILEEWRATEMSGQADRKRRLPGDDDERNASKLRSAAQSPSRMGQSMVNSYNLDTFTVGMRQSLQKIMEIPHVSGASFDSRAMENTSTCLENTRVCILSKIFDWAGSHDREPIFWLQGVAGTGKTTIAKTVAEISSRDNRLGASFFFSRGVGDRGNAEKLFSTLAYQLGFSSVLDKNRMQDLRGFINTTLTSTPEIFAKALSEQWFNLILQPLMLLEEQGTSDKPKPILIVIDALDECSPVGDVSLILELLTRSKVLRAFPLKFFLTGRPEMSIDYGFRRISRSVEQIILHNIETSVVKDDILRFIQHKFDEIRNKFSIALDWPSEEDIETLVSKTGGLFIYAATVCRFVGTSYPKRKLTNFLKYDRGDKSTLDQMYNVILRQSLSGISDDGMDDETLFYFNVVVGSIAVLFDTLSINTLSSLLSAGQFSSDSMRDEEIDADIVAETIRRLGSVLDVPNDRNVPVRIFHPSFRDFLLQEDRPGIMNAHYMKATKLHEDILKSCLATMNAYLKRDICDLKNPDTKATNLRMDFVTTCLPLHVHGGLVQQFASSKILYWLEAMSILGLIGESIAIINGLKNLLNDRELSEISALIRDFYRFLLKNRVLIERSPLQIYCSALLFSPSTSVTREIFHADTLSWLKKDPAVSRAWPVSVTLEPGAAEVICAGFSPDGKLIASGDSSGNVCIWNVATGLLQQTLKGHLKGVYGVAFSPDGQTLASGSFDSTIRLRDVATGSLQVTLQRCSARVRTIAYSHDGRFIASGDEQVAIWGLADNSLIRTLEGHEELVCALSFSQDDKTLLSASCDSRIRIWDISDGSLKGIIETGIRLNCATFTPDSRIIASAGLANKIEFWDADTRILLHSVETEQKLMGFHSLMFSPGGEIFAAGSMDQKVRIWDSKSWALSHTLGEHTSGVFQICFSPDGQCLASAAFDGTVRLWNIGGDLFQETFNAHLDLVSTIKFSSNGQLVASASYDSTIQLWDPSTGGIIHTLHEEAGAFNDITFSPDNRLIASASDDGIIRIWDTDKCSLVKTLQYGEEQNPAGGVAFSADGKLIACSFIRRGEVCVWTIASWTLLHIFKGDRDEVWSVEFSPGSNILVCGGLKVTYLWDLGTGSLLSSLDTPDFVTRLTFSPDGEKLFCRNPEGKAQCWDLSTFSMEKEFSNFLLKPRMFLSNGQPSDWSIQERWITFRGFRILFLPEDRQVWDCDVYGNTLVIGSPSGIVTFLWFKEMDGYHV